MWDARWSCSTRTFSEPSSRREGAAVRRARAGEPGRPRRRVQQVMAPQRGTGEGTQPSLLQPARQCGDEAAQLSRSAPSARPTSSPPGRPVTASSAASRAPRAAAAASEQTGTPHAGGRAPRRRAPPPMSLPSARKVSMARTSIGSVCRGSPRCRPCVAARGRLGLLLSASHRWGGSSSGPPDRWPSRQTAAAQAIPPLGACRCRRCLVRRRRPARVWSGTPDPRQDPPPGQAQHGRMPSRGGTGRPVSGWHVGFPQRTLEGVGGRRERSR